MRMAMRRQISSRKPKLEVVEEVAQVAAADDSNSKTKPVVKKKGCFFCRQKVRPHYWDAVALRRFISDRGRIIPRSRMGTCAKHQRMIADHIKYARHLSLLPFVVAV